MASGFQGEYREERQSRRFTEMAKLIDTEKWSAPVASSRNRRRERPRSGHELPRHPTGSRPERAPQTARGSAEFAILEGHEPGLAAQPPANRACEQIPGLAGRGRPQCPGVSERGLQLALLVLLRALRAPVGEPQAFRLADCLGTAGPPFRPAVATQGHRPVRRATGSDSRMGALDDSGAAIPRDRGRDLSLV